MNADYDNWSNEDKFSEPRTIPAGWDSAALGSAPAGSSTPPAGDSGLMEKFEEPRTIPGGWNTDALR